MLTAARQTGNKRTQLLLETICSTGIRVSELQYITAEAVRRRKASIRCKGKCREILLPAELCHRLQKWCQKHRIHNGPVFLSRAGKPLCRVTVWKLFKALCERAKVSARKVFPHNLRHLFARTFYNIKKISRSWLTCLAIPASRRRGSISWNRAPNTSACSIKCTCFCKL
ncbi:MAG: tyrosine-type recombinase/integrase [Subdoligranulum variabile]|nr:tyrosine-type recombinase/integrase [Subdoligranulum variabile]